MAMEDFERHFPEWAKALGPENTAALLRATSTLELPANRVFIRDRMPVDSLYLVLDGQVSISVEENGKAIKLATIGPGQVLGEVSVLSGELLASSTVTSDTPVKLLRLRHQAFEDLIATNYAVASVLLEHFVDMLADRLRASVKSFADLRDGAPPPQEPPADDSPTIRGKNWIKSFFDRVPGT
ncbi:MAG: cyclic nucleotide-binding domain-containing protein [Burkholderiales bacterium]|nr:cyclic nucleotide-binding domain-containing protein [Burkholderiales bacterium]